MKINQLKMGVMLSYISEAISILTGLLYTPVMLRLLGQSEYGVYQLSASVIAYLGLLSMGFGTSYVRYYSRYKANKDEASISKLNGMFMIIFIFIGIICALAGGVLVANIEHIFKQSLTVQELQTAKILMSLMVFNLVISFLSSVFVSHITANEQYIFQKIVIILQNILNPFLTIPFLLMGYKSIGVVAIQTALSVGVFITNMFFCKEKLKMSFNFKKFEIPFLRELFMFSFWIFLNQIIDQVNWHVDKFLLGMFSGTTAVAIYGVSAHINSLYRMFSISVSSVFIPRINKIVAESNDNRLLTDLFTRVGRIQFMILCLVLSGLIIFGKYFIFIWAGDGYEEAYQIILLLTIPVTIPLIQNLGISIQQAKNMHQFRSIIYLIIAVLNVITSIPLSKLYGGTGAAIGTAVSLIIGNGVIMNIFYHKKIGLNIIYFWKEIIRFTPSLIIPIILGVLIMKYIIFDSIIVFLMLIIAYTFAYCASMWLLGMNEYEKKLISKPIKKILRKNND